MSMNGFTRSLSTVGTGRYRSSRAAWLIDTLNALSAPLASVIVRSPGRIRKPPKPAPIASGRTARLPARPSVRSDRLVSRSWITRAIPLKRAKTWPKNSVCSTWLGIADSTAALNSQSTNVETIVVAKRRSAMMRRCWTRRRTLRPLATPFAWRRREGSAAPVRRNWPIRKTRTASAPHAAMSPAPIRSRLADPRGSARKPAVALPATPPASPPAPMNPNTRFACRGS